MKHTECEYKQVDLACDGLTIVLDALDLGSIASHVATDVSKILIDCDLNKIKYYLDKLSQHHSMWKKAWYIAKLFISLFDSIGYHKLKDIITNHLGWLDALKFGGQLLLTFSSGGVYLVAKILLYEGDIAKFIKDVLKYKKDC